MNTSLCTRGTPGKGLPSSAISEKPPGGSAGATAVPVCDPTTEGTCIRRAAFTMRSKTVPVIAVVTVRPVDASVPAAALNSEGAAFVLSIDAPLIRYYEVD